ncbi:tubulin-specific chaperone A-like [Acanthaster planci]|uniref:Tubulin-specific chaperone A n=1 Tax=Acanthaster planci TaxID=133434 RepID=A0A8B7Z8Z2_ACAPL|nr:tubulin-specific chaperone A-like [Acanthaster planci]
MAAQDPRIRNIKIKTGVLKRLVKEKAMYEKEVADQMTKVEQMKAGNQDEYNIKKQQEVLEESKMMIPDCTRRIKSAFSELKNLLETTEELQEEEDYKKASALVDEVSPNISM